VGIVVVVNESFEFWISSDWSASTVNVYLLVVVWSL